MKCNVKHNPNGTARNNANALSSWIIYISQDLGIAARWGKNEIDMLVDSVRCAYKTTEKITKRMVKPSKQNHCLSSGNELLLQGLGMTASECMASEYNDSGHMPLQYDVEFQQLVKHFPSLIRKVVSKEAPWEKHCREKTMPASNGKPSEIIQKTEVVQKMPGEVPNKTDIPEGAMTEKTEFAGHSNKNKKVIRKEADVSMAENRDSKMRWYSFMTLADRANEQFLSVARSAGKTVRLIQPGTMGSVSKIGHRFSRERKKEKFGKPGATGKIKERAPTDETPEEEGMSLQKITTETDVVD